MTKVTIVLTLLLLLGCKTEVSVNKKKSFPKLSSMYLNQKKPNLSPEIFAPNIISTAMAEINACFSPDYKEFFYSIILPNKQYVIMRMFYSDKKWSEPEVANFSGKYSDADPFISVDGQWMYLVSKRPIDGSKEMKKDWDIWRLQKINGEWTNMERLGSDINSASNDIYPTLTKDGTLYYSSAKTGKNNDLYYAKSDGNSFKTSIKMNDEINAHWEGDVYISPNEDYMIYGSYGRQQGSGLYITFNTNGKWSTPVRMNEEINETGNEFCPIVSPDGKYFFFTSDRKKISPQANGSLSYKKIKDDYFQSYNSPANGQYDVYWVDAKIIESYRRNNQ